MTITPLTPALVESAAREAAEQRIPLDEANHHEPGSENWARFNRAYNAAAAAIETA